MGSLNNIQAFKPGTVQVVAYTGTSAASSNAFGTGTHLVRLVATTDCHIKFAGTPTATTSDMFLPAFTAEYFLAGEGEKVAAIQLSSGGNLNVTEMTK